MVWMISLKYCGVLIFARSPKFLSWNTVVGSKEVQKSSEDLHFLFFAVARMCRRMKMGWLVFLVGQKPNCESGIWCSARAQSINKCCCLVGVVTRSSARAWQNEGKKPIRLGKGKLLPKQKNPPWKTTVWEIGPRSQEHKLRVCLQNRQKKA